MLETLVDYNDRNNAYCLMGSFSNQSVKLWKKRKRKNVTPKLTPIMRLWILFIMSPPITTNTQGEISNVTNEKRISSEILTETIKGFNGLTIQSTINDSENYDSEEDDAESDPNSNPRVSTHTSNRKKIKSLILTLPMEILRTNY